MRRYETPLSSPERMGLLMRDCVLTGESGNH